MKKLLLLLLFVGIASMTVARSEIRKSQVAFADPYILLDGDYYYAYGTNHNDGIECWRSTNLVGWEYMGLALHKDNCTEKQWFWAPEVYHKNGKYYMYYSANEHLFVATSNSPTGPFYQQGGYQMQNILGSEKCIDSHVFFDDDGSAWLFFARFVPDERIYSCRLSSDLMTPVSGTLRQCLSVTEAWENIWPTVVEGPNVIKRNGIYYLTYSANSYESHDYAVGYATTTNLATGTWSKYSGNPILRRMEDMVGCGHHSLFYDKVGNLKIAYHSHYSTTSIHPRLLYFGDMYFEGNVLRFNYGIQSLRPLQATEALSYVTERWNFSDLRANPTAKGYDARKVRNIAYKDGKLYCVYDHDNIKVISAETGDDLGNLKTGDICQGGTRRFCDVKVFNGHVVACNLALAGEELRIYTWDNDNAEPRLLMSTTDFYGAPRLGDCLEIAPNSNWDNNLWINFCNDDGSKTRVIEYHFDGNGWASNAWEVTTDGTNQFKTGPTARAYPNGGVWWIDGMDCKPSFFVIQNGKLVRQIEIKDVSNLGTCHHEFNFRGYKYSVNLKYDGEYFGRARIQMDDAGDYSHTTWLGEYPWQGFSSTNKNDYGTGDIIVDTDGDNYVRLFVCCRGEGLACFAQGNPPEFKPTYLGGFNLQEQWNCSENAQTLFDKGYDASKINNFCYGNGKLYCVYDHSVIKTLDAQTGEYLGDMPMSDIVAGGTYALSDVVFADGHLIACNYARSGEDFRIYSWADDMLEPELLHHTTDLGGANALGKCMEVSGDASFARDIWLTFGEDNGERTTIYELHRDINKNWELKTTRVKIDASTELRAGENCRVYPMGGPFWIDGNDCQPLNFNYNADAGCLTKSLEVPTGDSWGGAHKAQFWGNTKYSFDIKFDEKKNGRIRLITDNNGDYSNNTLIGEYPSAGLGSTVNTSGAGDLIVRSNGINYVEAWVFAEGQGIAYYSLGIVNRVVPKPTGKLQPVEKWNLSERRGNASSKGYDASKIRNFSYMDGKLYCVYNNSQIKVLNAQTGDDLGNLRLGTVVAGGTLTLSDVKCFQGHVIACNLAKPGEEFRLYAWDGDKQDPYLLYSTTDFQGCTSLGEAVIPAEDSFFDTSFWLNLCNDNGTASTVVELHRNKEGVWNKYHRKLTTDGTSYFHVGANARAYPNGGVWWINGNDCQPTFCSWSNGGGSPISINTTHSLGEPWGNSYHEFNFAGNRYAVVPQFESRTGDDPSTFYRNCRMRIDVANNDDHTGLINRGSYPTDGLGDAQNPDCTADAMINTDGSTFVEAWVFSTNQGLAYYTWGNVPAQNPQPLPDPDPTPEPTPDPAPFDDDITAMTEVWNYSGNTTLGSWLDISDDYIRTIAYKDGKIYALHCKNGGTPAIKIIDAYTGAQTGSLSVNGIQNALFKLSGIAVMGGKIVASSISSAGTNFYIYIWDDDSSDPRILVTDATHDGEVVGAQLSVSGDLNNGRLWINNDGTSKLLYYTVTNGTASQTPTVINLTKNGAAFAGGNGRGSAEVVYNSDGTIWLAPKDAVPTLFDASGAYKTSLNSGIVAGNQYGTAMKFIPFGEKQYLATTTYKSGTTDGGFTLTNITDGIESASNNLFFYPEAGLGATSNAQRTSSLCYATRNDGHVLDIWVAVTLQGVAYYTYNGEGQSAVEAIAAGAAALRYNGREVSLVGADAARISVYSTSGAMVADVRGENTLNVSLLSRGVYIVRAIDREGNVAVSKILR